MKKNFSRRSSFLENFAQDALFFIFLLFMLSIYRAAFIFLFRDQLLATTTPQDILLTMWYGLRIGLKTAGAFFLPSFVLGTLLKQIFPSWKANKFRFLYGSFVILIFAFLFQTRLAYYQEFQNAFSPFIFNTVHDDMWAIMMTAIDQHHALVRSLVALLQAAGGCFILKYFLIFGKKLGEKCAASARKTLYVVLICIFLVPTAVFVRRGGSFDFNGSIYWKNAARMSQHLLNEAILDDIQALYKASRIYKQFAKMSADINAEDVRKAAAYLLGTDKYNEDSLIPFLEKKAQGAKIQKPQHIFVIVAENYMLWPLLKNYRHLPISKGIQSILQKENAILIDKFLPASNGTMFAITSILLGMPEINLLTANRPTAQEPYETALSVQLKKQGYKTRFFYGGFPSWENIGPFMKHQKMDESFYFADLGGEGSVWGVQDKTMLRNAAQKITPEPSFNLILTSTNHTPYTLDTKKEKELTDEKELKKFLPDDISDENLFLQRLQHFEYADHHLTDFVLKMYEKYPDSLFIITGDHAARWTLKDNPSLYERLSVPLVIFGKGISKQMLPAHAAASHMDIAATVLELILPKGTPYYALGEDILSRQTLGLHTYNWINPYALGTHNIKEYELLDAHSPPLSPQQQKEMEEKLKAYRIIAAWRILKGTELKD